MIPIEQLDIDIKKDNIFEGIMKSNGFILFSSRTKSWQIVFSTTDCQFSN